MLKGQYRIVTEIIIFGVGVGILSFIIVNFSSIEDSISRTSVNSQLKSASNIVMLGIVKASLNTNSSIRISMPSSFSGNSYMISLEDCKTGGGCLMVLSKYSGTINVSRGIFNINQSYNITGWAISSANYIDITSNNSDIIFRRM